MFSPAGPLDHLQPACATPNGRGSSSVDNSTSVGWYPLQVVMSIHGLCRWNVLCHKYIHYTCLCASHDAHGDRHSNVQYDQHPNFWAPILFSEIGFCMASCSYIYIYIYIQCKIYIYITLKIPVWLGVFML